MSRTVVAPPVEGWRNIEATTDGSCLRNPGPGGWAAILREGTREMVIAGGEPNSTCNRMELAAILKALQKIGDRSNVLIRTDSQYSIDACECLTRFMTGKSKKTPKNLDILKEIYPEMMRHRVRFEWIKGHAFDELNNRADGLARAEALKFS